MRHLIFLCPLLALSLPGCTPEAPVPARPNIIYILADDLGYGELGAYGQDKIETPNLDQLTRNGMLFTQHYTGAPVCAPARYMLLTGRHSGHAYIRGNDEWDERGDVWNFRTVANAPGLEGQRPIPDTTVMLPQKLKEAGYTTGMVGKWGLGAPQSKSIPTNMGFDYFYGYNCQRQAHTYYPLHLWENEERVFLANDTVPPGTKLPEGANPYTPESYAAYTQPEYASDRMFEALTEFVHHNRDTSFFLYWATPIPHVPLQAPERWVQYYREKFGEEEPYLGDQGYFPHQYPRAAYAAMISYLDENIGTLIDQLKAEGIYENTLIFFTSDNGPTYAGGADTEWFDSAGPFGEAYGRGKGFVYEGGIRVPLIASWPGQIPPGSHSDHISIHYDMLATLGQLTGYDVPADTDGISFLSSLLGKDEQQQKHNFLYWEYPEYGGQIAIRSGDWKLIRRHLKDDQPPTLELYNLATDSTEQHNVASQHPERLNAFADIFAREHEKAEVERFFIPVLERGLLADQ